MKKLFYLLVAVMMVTFAANNVHAQTRIGKEHIVDLGIHYGYGSGRLANFLGLNVDVNAAKTNFRVRASFDAFQRAVENSPMVVGAMVNAQYLFPLLKDDANDFYLYPSLGLGCDYHKAPVWGAKNWGLGFNVGGGVEYQYADRWAFFVEVDYQVRFGNESHVAPMIGFSCAF